MLLLAPVTTEVTSRPQLACDDHDKNKSVTLSGCKGVILGSYSTPLMLQLEERCKLQLWKIWVPINELITQQHSLLLSERSWLMKNTCYVL